MKLLESYVFEVLRKSDKTGGGQKDNISFVEDAFYKKDSMKHFQNFDWSERSREFEGKQFIVRECKELIVVFMMSGENPAGYVGLDRFGGGVKIGTLAVGMKYRSGAAKKIYSFIVDEFGKLYSDDNQTPQARGLWNSLYKSGKFKVYGVDTRDGMKKYSLKSMEKYGDLSSKELGIIGLTDKLARSRYVYGDEDTKTSKRMLICIEKLDELSISSVTDIIE